MIFSVPRTRGDEPDRYAALRAEFAVFPAHAGMNRWPICAGTIRTSVPRTRGDEPISAPDASGNVVCSPHTRG